jgi:hypothetical protein
MRSTVLYALPLAVRSSILCMTVHTPRPMKRTKPSRRAESPAAEPAPPRVSLRAIHAQAMKEVMADPRRALAEHDPWLAALLGAAPGAPAA